MLLVVYGTLREGEALSPYLDEFRKKGDTVTIRLPGVKMFVLGDFPGAKVTNNPNDQIIAELMDVQLDINSENKLLNMLDMLEGVHTGLFKRYLIDTYKGPALIYITEMNTEGALEITDWIEDWSNKTDKEKAEALKEYKQIGLLM